MRENRYICFCFSYFKNFTNFAQGKRNQSVKFCKAKNYEKQILSNAFQLFLKYPGNLLLYKIYSKCRLIRRNYFLSSLFLIRHFLNFYIAFSFSMGSAVILRVKHFTFKACLSFLFSFLRGHRALNQKIQPQLKNLLILTKITVRESWVFHLSCLNAIQLEEFSFLKGN